MMSASSWAPEAFACPICLDILTDPTTLPCGHSYCLLCIQKHWDKSSTRGSYECPQCRQKFSPRPVLARSRVLMEALEKLRLSAPDEPLSTSSSSAGLYPALPSASPLLCPLHQQVLELYCCDDQQSVCEDCSLLTHKAHQVVRPEEQRLNIQQELVEMSARIQSSIADRDKLLQGLPQVSEAHKGSLQQLMAVSQAVFTDVLRVIEVSGSQVLELLQAHESSSCVHIQAQTLRLQQEISGLQRRQEELQRLESIQDPVAFLTTFRAMEAVDPAERAALGIQSPESVVSGVTSALDAFRETAVNLTKTSLAAVFRVVNDAAAAAQSSGQCSDGDAMSTVSLTSPNAAADVKPRAEASSTATLHNSPGRSRSTNGRPPTTECVSAASASAVEGSASCCVSDPAPKSREEMLKFRIELTLDLNSVFRHIRLSDGFRKATLCAEKQNYPDHAERFIYWRQVMCVEPLAGSPYYWEVEWTGQRVTVGVAYRDMERSAADDSARLGHNSKSWSLYWSGKAFSLWHAGKETALLGPKAKRIGVYLDQQAGVLAFYRVSHSQAQEICCVHAQFDGPLFACFRFWSGVGSSISICELH